MSQSTMTSKGQITIPKDIRTELGLEPGSNLDELLDWSQRQRAGDIAWVGHAPDLGVMAAALLGLSGGPGVRFAKGAVAAINFESGSPARGMGELHWLATAKLLGY